MLTRHSVLGEAACIETVPTIGFVTTEDGRTLVALTENDDGLLEIMAAPMTLITQNPAATGPIFKSVDGSLLLNPPMFQINVEGISSGGVQRTLLLPTQPIDNSCNIVEQPRSVQGIDIRQGASSLEEDLSSLGLESIAETTRKSNVDAHDTASAATDKSVPPKKSPGRPKKNEVNESLKCDICDREFTKQSLYRKHMDHHAEEKPHRCPKCPASFNIPSNFTLHMATHNTGDPKCPECGRKFARMASLKSHMIHHEKEENLFCTECEDAFATRAQLDAHLKLHGEKWSSGEARKCKLCNKQFIQPALYRLHIREHYRLQTRVTKQTKRGAKHKTMYKCTICLKSFQKPSQLLRHIRVHTGEKPFKCTICGRGFTQKSSLQIHTWQHKGIRPHTCELCKANFSQKGNLNAHILRVHNAPEGEPIYACTYCSCVFKKLGSLNGHIKRMHTNESVAKADEMLSEADIKATVDSVMSQLASLESTTNPGIEGTANLTAATNPAENADSSIAGRDDILQQALDNSGLLAKKKAPPETKVEARTNFVTLLDRSSDGGTGKYLTIKQRCIGNVRWYACSFCHKEFKKPSDLIRHLRVHTQEKPFKCTHCFRSFALKSTMIAHERTHTGTKKYTCNTCDKTFAGYGSLVSHIRVQHGDGSTNSETGGKSSDSSKSQTKSSKSKSKISPEAENLAQDVVLQEPLVISDLGNRICVAQVASKQKQVYDEKPDVARPHKCWVCHAAFRKISHLKQHYRRHTGERPYKCTKCDRRFTSNSVLKSHLHTHEDLRPYSCSVCDTKFSTQSSMKRHLVTHSTRRPFMCPYCHKTFKTYVNCRKHMKIHKHELAQQQLDQQKIQDDGGKEITLNVEVSSTPPVLSENALPIVLSEGMDMNFQPRIENVFTQNLTEHLDSITEAKDKSVLTTSNVDARMDTHVPENLQDVDTTAVTHSQMLHADERGAVTLPGYSGDQTLTSESIREIEETLNQQLFNIGMNLGLGANLSGQIDESNATALDTTREQPTLNIPYDTSKEMDTAPGNVFTSQFDSFDMSQITLQPDVEIDIGLVDTPNTTSMASILPKSAKEEEHLIAVSSESQMPNLTTSVAVSTSTVDPHEAPSLPQNCTNPTNGVQIILSCENGTIPISLAESFTTAPLPKAQSNTQDALLSDLIDCNEDESRRLPESLLQCHLCNERGLTAEGLKEHLKTHRGTKEFQCSECPLRFCTNGGLNRHSKMHVTKQQWKCTVCHKIVASKSQLKLHSKEHEDTLTLSSQNENTQIQVSASELRSIIPSNAIEVEPDSSISEKVLMDTVAEREVMERLNCIPTKKEQKEYTNRCKYCPKTFRKPSDLIRHIRTHTGERPYKCDFCSKSFAVKCTLDSHIKVHTGKRTFRCHVCSSLFATKGSLKVHMRLHTGSKPFRCPICDMKFRTSGHRKVHLLKHTRESKGACAKRKQKIFKVTAVAEAAAALGKSDDCTEKIANLPAAQQLECAQNAEYCNLQEVIGIESGGDLTDHITFSTEGAILNNNSVLSVNESNQIVANLHFLLANGLVTIQTDETPLLSQATAPEAAALIPNDLVNLAVSIAGPEPPTELPTAENSIQPSTVTQQVTIPSISLLQVPNVPDKSEHQTSKQTTRGNFSKKECDICGKTFMKPYQVERHKRIHTGERPYKCDLCTKSFAQKSTLQMHQKHHTGDRPHPCPHCEYSFTQKGNLRTHVKRVHQLDTLDVKKLRRSRQNSAPKPIQAAVPEAKILTFDDISFVEFLK